MTFESPSEFPSKKDQLEQLKTDEAGIRENLRKLNVEEKDIEDLLKGFSTPKNLTNLNRTKILEEIKKLKGINIRKDFLEGGGNEFPSTPDTSL